jgi:transcriptional regulator with XRE-family HTH domain
MVDLYQHIAATIKRLRTVEKLSQEALASRIAEPANTVSRWETATYRPSADQLEKLARFFEVSITVFFPGMEVETKVPSALLSATRGLKKNDMNEIVRYAEYRKARAILRDTKRTTRNVDDK